MLRFAIIRSFEVDTEHPVTGDVYKEVKKAVVLEFSTKQIIKKLAKYLLAELPLKNTPVQLRIWPPWKVIKPPLAWTYPEISKAMEDAFWNVVKELKDETIRLA